MEWLKTWQPIVSDVLQKVWDEYGLFAVLLIFFFVYHEYRMNRVWHARLGDKDREIERVVEARNRLEDAVLSKRLTSEKKDA